MKIHKFHKSEKKCVESIKKSHKKVLDTFKEMVKKKSNGTRPKYDEEVLEEQYNGKQIDEYKKTRTKK
ncbi:MAG: hypothetical protein DRQ88_09345 [Epsilonproteobacteria bacterium]|nr:MAG: hypothetical protein DRQ88_09345 [Campylobacterota bacterium]